jgi:F-type H+-transporting ATPase subunit a
MEEHHASWLNALVSVEPAWLRPYVDVFVIHVLLVVLLLGLGAWLITRRLALIPRGNLQSLGEWIYESLAGFAKSILPHHGERYVGIIGSFFLFILAMNLFGLIPGCLSPTSRLNTTLALGLMAIISAQVIGMRENGMRYWKRFVPDLSGIPTVRDIGDVSPVMKVILLPVFLPLKPFLFVVLFILKPIEELVKPLSLAIRLFGNVFGDDTVIAQFALLGAGALTMILHPTGGSALVAGGGVLIALLSTGMTVVMAGFAVFVSFIQAFVFAFLTATYILFAIEME